MLAVEVADETQPADVAGDGALEPATVVSVRVAGDPLVGVVVEDRALPSFAQVPGAQDQVQVLPASRRHLYAEPGDGSAGRMRSLAPDADLPERDDRDAGEDTQLAPRRQQHSWLRGVAVEGPVAGGNGDAAHVERARSDVGVRAVGHRHDDPGLGHARVVGEEPGTVDGVPGRVVTALDRLGGRVGSGSSRCSDAEDGEERRHHESARSEEG